MLNNFDHRFPLSDDTILASLLDPSCQNLLEVKNYLKSAGYTAVEFIKKCALDIIKEDDITTTQENDRHKKIMSTKQSNNIRLWLYSLVRILLQLKRIWSENAFYY